MEKVTHATKDQIFEDLSYADQAKMLNTQITVFEKSINAHLRKANAEGKNMYETREKFISQLEKIINGIG